MLRIAKREIYDLNSHSETSLAVLEISENIPVWEFKSDPIWFLETQHWFCEKNQSSDDQQIVFHFFLL